MKRTLCLFTLCFLFLLPAVAMANVEIDAPHFEKNGYRCNLNSYVETEETTYILCPACNQLLTYHEEDNTFTALPFRYVGGQDGTEEYADDLYYFHEDEGKLYVVSLEGEAVYQVTITQEEAQLTGLFCPDLSWTNRRNKGSVSPYIRGAAVIDGVLYLSVGYLGYFDEYLQSSQEYAQEFFCYDLATGKRTVLNDFYGDASVEIYDMIPYHGKLICKVLTKRQITSPAEEARFALLPPLPKEPILLYDPATNEYESIYTAMPNLIASNDGWYYGSSKERDCLFWWDENNRIYLVQEEESPVLVGMLMNENSFPIIPLPSGRLLVGSVDDYCTIVPVDENYQVTTLTIDNCNKAIENFYQAIHDFQRINANYVFDVQLRADLNAAFSDGLTTQSDATDLYIVPLGTTLTTALSKGFYLPFASSQQAAEYADNLLDFIKPQLLAPDGDVGAVPVYFDSNLDVSFSRYVMDELGITQEDIPTTWNELADFVLSWEDTYGDAANEKNIALCLFDPQSLRYMLARIVTKDLVSMACTNYDAMKQGQDELLSLLAKLQKIPTSYHQQVEVAEKSREIPVLVDEQPNYLMSIRSSILPSRRLDYTVSLENFQQLTLSYFNNQPPVLLVNGYALVGNPYSSRKEETQLFLNYLLTYANPFVDTAVLKNAEPVTWYTEKELAQDKASYESAIEYYPYASDEIKGYLETEIATYENTYKLKDQWPYRISPAHLDEYHAFLQDGTILIENNSLYNGTVRKAETSYLRGYTNGSEFLSALLNAAWIYQLEGE